MYLDKLDGRVHSAFFDKMSAQWREEQNRCLREIERHESAEQSYMDEGVQILELARNAQKLFEQQQPREKRRLLNFVLSSCSWEDGEVVATFRQPFDLLAQTAAVATRAAVENRPNSAKNGIWLGRLDSNQGMAESKSAALPLGYAPIRTCRGRRERGRTIAMRAGAINGAGLHSSCAAFERISARRGPTMAVE
jgi:hypothetical protein